MKSPKQQYQLYLDIGDQLGCKCISYKDFCHNFKENR